MDESVPAGSALAADQAAIDVHVVAIITLFVCIDGAVAAVR